MRTRTFTLAESLETRIHSAADTLLSDCARAELAAYHARMGAYPLARTAIAELRSSSPWRSIRLSGWLLFAEAMTRLEDEFDRTALDRLNRGYAIAAASSDLEQVQVFAAWLAHFHYNGGQYAEMAKWIDRCLVASKALVPASKARLALTLAGAFRHIGEQDLAGTFFTAARLTAVDLGDEAFLAACMYNRAAYGISRLRLEFALGAPRLDHASQLMLEIDSAANYAVATGNRAATFLQSLWKARLYLILQRAAEALELLDAVMVNLPEAKHPRMLLGLQADRATCLLDAGRSDELATLLPQLMVADDHTLEPDDAVVYWTQVASIARHCGDSNQQEICARRLLDVTRLQDLTLSDLRGCILPFASSTIIGVCGRP